MVRCRASPLSSDASRHLTSLHTVINIQTSVRSHVLKKKLKNNRTVTLTDHEKTPVLAGPPIELPDKTIEFYSTQEQGLKGVLKTVDGGKQRIIEVWKWAAGVRLLEKDVTKECGDFLDDGQSRSVLVTPF